ncbi:hypothetical protein C4D60_Mb01t18970 [Musa balbisiana]|uniref:Uncharacterized protein n=1 Tax=Musa balbisiana TaxID=52838 RepID=A0A4V4H7G9_MUSBA|nr:hypothetical protein C4D60_Mb01t18970 [Musa balbisiana]
MTMTEVQNILCELGSSRNTNCGVGRYQKYVPSLQTGKSGSSELPYKNPCTRGGEERKRRERRRSSSPLNAKEGNPRPEKPDEPRHDLSSATDYLSNFKGR